MDVNHNTLTAGELHKAKIATGSSSPAGSSTDFDGELLAQISSDRTTLWVAIFGAWVAIAGTPIFGFSNPGGSVTPDYKGQRYYNSSTDQEYLAVGTTNADWIQFAAGSSAGGGS